MFFSQHGNTLGQQFGWSCTYIRDNISLLFKTGDCLKLDLLWPSRSRDKVVLLFISSIFE